MRVAKQMSHVTVSELECALCVCLLIVRQCVCLLTVWQCVCRCSATVACCNMSARVHVRVCLRCIVLLAARIVVKQSACILFNLVC